MANDSDRHSRFVFRVEKWGWRPFIVRWYVERVSWITVSHQSVLVLLFVSLLGFVPERSTGDDDVLTSVIRSLVAIVLVVPTRLIIQSLLLRLFNSERITVAHPWGPLIPRIVSPGLLLASRQFLTVEMSPFIIIASLFQAIIIAFPEHTYAAAVGVLANGAISIVDIAIVNALWRYRHEELYTFDDESGGLTVIAHIPTDANPDP